MANLNIRTWNKKGSVDKYATNLGSVTAFIDNDQNYIHVDTKHGKGDNHTEREQSEVYIVIDGTVHFTGTLEQLKEKLR